VNREIFAIMRRPRWVAALALAIGIAAGFAFLGHWQLERAIESGTVVARPTEKSVVLETIAKPQRPMTDASDAQLVNVEGKYVPGDFEVVAGRLNEGKLGYWVVGHLVTDSSDAADLAIGVGWTRDAKNARAVEADLNGSADQLPTSIEGRYVASDAPELPHEDESSQTIRSMAVAQLTNRWQEVSPGGVYAGYVTLTSAPDGLTDIYSPAPVEEVQLNLLNVFYSVEWVLFAGVAIYIWYRMVRDVWVRERDQTSNSDEIELSHAVSPESH
jgi:surfeit locus 1 family protein